MNEIIDRKHSRYGVASCLIGVLNLGYTGNLLFDWFNFVNDLVSMGPGAIFGLFFIPLLFLIIPAIGSGIGIIVGIVSLSQANHKRLFAVIGLIMNIAGPAILLISFLLYNFK